ncbi:MAG: hypothetical protein E6I84_16190 [Chloroflexi bacterium]|nr:MAG: hypothetical protein E6I84_16190 [Chloroflexota bacterium]
MAIATPGVYTREFEPAPPIQGVGTSNAAFLGAARLGPLLTPVEITSWDAFRATFGDQPVPGRYLWYAVRGFFENGGTTCYIVRISNATLASLTLQDGGGHATIVVTALAPGATGNSITVQVDPAHAITGNVFQHAAPVNFVSGQATSLCSPATRASGRPWSASPARWCASTPPLRRSAPIRCSWPRFRARLATRSSGSRTLALIPPISPPAACCESPRAPTSST